MNSLTLVFQNRSYLILSGILFVGFLFPLLLISEYLFLEPYFIGHIPKGSELGFVLIIAVSVLASLVIPMNIYRIRILRRAKNKISGSVLGSILGASAGACSCGPIGFAVISTFGTLGGVVSAFLTNYEIPLRIGAVALLMVTYYTTSRSLKMECRLKP